MIHSWWHYSRPYSGKQQTQYTKHSFVAIYSLASAFYSLEKVSPFLFPWSWHSVSLERWFTFWPLPLCNLKLDVSNTTGLVNWYQLNFHHQLAFDFFVFHCLTSSAWHHWWTFKCKSYVWKDISHTQGLSGHYKLFKNWFSRFTYNIHFCNHLEAVYKVLQYIHR